MTFGGALYRLLIGPLELFFEVVYSLAYRLIGNEGLAIVFLSLAMNFLVLPLYKRADAMQAEERDQAARMKPWVDHIRKTFKGDERFMMLQTYYRQNNYKQTDALKGSISLLLEIPFFIAAYRFLSGLQLLQGVPFGPIRDLGAPDALLTVAGVSINVLPILMTAVNAVSAAIYMKGFPLKSKIQMYGMALIFLVFLYTSPAGLVFYWTLNNVFSLLKNIFYKMKNPRLVLNILFSLTGIAGLVWLLRLQPTEEPTHLMQAMEDPMQRGLLIALLAALELPLVFYLLGKLRKQKDERAVTPSEDRIFLYGSLFVTILVGILIPSSVIATSPAEFVDVDAYRSPLWIIVSTALMSAGTFLVWFGIFYRLASPGGKRFFSWLMWFVSVAAVVNYMFFGTEYGNISPMLQFDVTPEILPKEMLVNMAIMLGLALLLFLIWKKAGGFVRVISLTMCLAIAVMGGMNVVNINRAMVPVKENVLNANEETPHFTMSKEGKNVVVLMMDRATSYYLPFLMNEKPELEEKLAGFTFYPNTISYGSATNVGAPALFGGYEYTPEGMNARDNLLLSEKHNEALKIMPQLFDENGYKVTVSDPTYAGYTWIPDLSIYDEYPNIHKFITSGRFTIDEYGFQSYADRTESTRERSMFCYSLFKTAPLVAQPLLYDDGNYHSTISDVKVTANRVGMMAIAQVRDGLSKASGLDERFMDAYSVLYHLPDITEIVDNDDNTFLMMSNDTTHAPAMLKEPEYIPAWEIDNTAFDEEHALRYDAEGNSVDPNDESKILHYQINMAALLKLGDWFDYLRENDVWDNTRIIIVSDHGWPLWQENEIKFWIPKYNGDGEVIRDMLAFNCMLLVKDFDSDDAFHVDTQFMTNADTPTIAFSGLIEDPINPFTGNPINSDGKNEPEHHLLYANNVQTDLNNGTTFLPDDWFSVSGDIFTRDSWEYLGVR